jgi:hypothetical protein
MNKHSAQNETVENQQILVNGFFKDVKDVERVKRKKVSEGQLFALIQSALKEVRVPQTKLLEDLRNSQGIACEQGRFRKAYQHAIESRP